MFHVYRLEKTALLLFSLTNLCVGDIDFGCPSWGCLPWGSFSLSCDAPSKGEVKWTTGIDSLGAGQEDLTNTKGCVSDQQTVVCATHSGYVSLDPSNGKKLWSYKTRAQPYLPIMDIYGDVIGMDKGAMYYVGADGKPKQPISIGVLKPSFSLMVGNNSIMIITATTNKTAQIVTYGTDGVVDGAMELPGSINQVNGSFIPCSQPIIAGSRAYVVTYFFPDDQTSQEAVEVTGMMRLYAIDLLHQLFPRIVISWYFNFGRWYNYDNAKADGLEPIVTYFRETVYVNLPGTLSPEFHQQRFPHARQPYPGTLWAIQDTGNGANLLFRTSSLYGPMAVYDTYDKPIGGGKEKQRPASPPHALWVMNHSPAMLVAHDTLNGTRMNVTGLDKIFEQLNGWITSRISITRSKNAPDTDVLVFGLTDSTGQAKMAAVEVSGNGQATLRWSAMLAKPKANNTTVVVTGQIVNVALSYDIADQAAVTWKPGLIALVTERGSNSSVTSAVAVF